MASLPYFAFAPDGFADTADVILEVESQRLPAHSQFLASQSKFMHNILQDLGRSRKTFTDEEQLVIPASMLSDFTAQDVEAFLCQVYDFSHNQPRTVAQAHQLFRLADRFDSTKLLKRCVDFLCSQHDALFKPTTQEDGALKWALLAEQYGLDEILERVLKYIACNFCILQSDPRLGQLRAATLLQLAQQLHVMTSLVKNGTDSDHYETRPICCTRPGCTGHRQHMARVHHNHIPASGPSYLVGDDVQACPGHYF